MSYSPIFTRRMAGRLIIGFLAGVLATVLFHQLTWALLWGLGVAPVTPFSMTATWPFGIPAVGSLAFWGGIWGILFTLLHHRFPRRAYWALAFLFGAVAPTVVALVVVLPLKGQPIGGGWGLPRLLTAALCNGTWGVGTGLIVKGLSDRFKAVSDKGIR